MKWNYKRNVAECCCSIVFVYKGDVHFVQNTMHLIAQYIQESDKETNKKKVFDFSAHQVPLIFSCLLHGRSFVIVSRSKVRILFLM